MLKRTFSGQYPINLLIIHQIITCESWHFKVKIHNRQITLQMSLHKLSSLLIYSLSYPFPFLLEASSGFPTHSECDSTSLNSQTQFLLLWSSWGSFQVGFCLSASSFPFVNMFISDSHTTGLSLSDPGVQMPLSLKPSRPANTDRTPPCPASVLFSPIPCPNPFQSLSLLIQLAEQTCDLLCLQTQVLDPQRPGGLPVSQRLNCP